MQAVFKARNMARTATEMSQLYLRQQHRSTQIPFGLQLFRIYYGPTTYVYLC